MSLKVAQLRSFKHKKIIKIYFFYKINNDLVLQNSKKTFEIAEKMVAKMRFKEFSERFWKYSYFNQTICDIYSLNYCDEEYSK